MGISARLVKGAKILDLSTSPYTVDFIPPSLLPVNNLTEGTSANRTGGSDLVGTKYANRELDIAVRVLGTNEATIREAANRLTRFAAKFNDPAERLYFEFKPNTALLTPSWGQLGAPLRYEVVGCVPSIQDVYNIDIVRSQGYRVILSLTVKPFALGAEQTLCAAAGGVQEDNIGAADGLSRGLTIPSAGTNLFTNPIFGNTTYDTGWTAGTSMRVAQNTDPDYYLFGTCSVRLTRFSTTAAATYTLSINVGDTNPYTISCFAKRADGSAVTASDLLLYYGSQQTPTIASVTGGNGWYRLYTTMAGTASALASGVKALTDVYVDGFQLEAGSVATPMMHGEMLGHAWSGAAHASTSTRTAGTVKLPQAGALSAAQGGACIVWTPGFNFSQMGTNAYFFASDAGTLRLVLSNTSSRFSLLDGAGTAQSGSITIGAGTPVVLHASWGPSGMAIYTNGTLGGTSAYVPPVQGTSLHIGGRNDTGAYQACGAINGFTLFDRELGSAEILAHYNAISGMVSAGKRVDYIPWLWTKDGDSVVDNCADSTRNNYAVAGGVPGSEDADTTFKLTTASPYWNESLWLGKHVDRREYRAPGTYFSTEGYSSSQVVVSGNSNDDAYTTGLSGDYGWGLAQRAANEMVGPVHYFARACGTAGSAHMTPALRANFGETFGNYITAAVGTAYKLFYGGQMDIQWPSMSADASSYYLTLWTHFKVYGSAQVDFFQWINGPLAMVTPGTVSTPHVSSFSRAYSAVLWLHGRESTYDGTVTYYPDQRGDEIELTPGALNTLQSFIGNNAGTHTITRTFTYSAVKVVPRWGLI